MRRYFYASIIATVVHIALIFAVIQSDAKTALTQRNYFSLITKVNLSDTTKSQLPAEEKLRHFSQPSMNQPSETTFRAIVPQKKSESIQDSSKSLSFKNLFPTAGELSIAQATSAEERPNHSYRGIAYQKIKIDSDTLHGLFDVPLIVRELVGQGSAFLQVMPLDQNQTLLKSLTGEPYLRAVMYDALQNSTTKKVISQLADVMATRQLRIQLTIQSKYGNDHRQGKFEEQIEFFKNQIVMTRTMYLDRNYGSSSGGIGLPDKDAEKSRRHDRLQANLLRMSPGYQSVIRNRKI